MASRIEIAQHPLAKVMAVDIDCHTNGILLQGTAAYFACFISVVCDANRNYEFYVKIKDRSSSLWKRL